MDVGSTAPFLDDGLARYKRKWGFAPEADPLSPLIAIQTASRAGVAQALGGGPVLAATANGLAEI